MNTELENAAISEVFLSDSSCKDDRAFFVKHFFDHPAVSTEDYSSALYHSHHCGNQSNELFKWLIERADHQDLEAVKEPHLFSQMDPDFRDAINATLENVSSDPRAGNDTSKRSSSPGKDTCSTSS